MYEHVIAKLTKPSELERASPEKVDELRRRFPSISDDYLIFLKEVGWGDIGGMMIYSGPGTLEDIYPSLASELAGILAFGDDWQGSCFGFDIDNQYSLVEIVPGGRIVTIDEDFKTFIAEYAS